MSLLCLPAVYLSFGTVTGRGAGIAMLALLAGMKLLETRTLRDAYVVCFLGYFLVITNFLFSQSIPTGLYMLVVLVVMTLAGVDHPAATMLTTGRFLLSGRAK